MFAYNLRLLAIFSMKFEGKTNMIHTLQNKKDNITKGYYWNYFLHTDTIQRKSFPYIMNSWASRHNKLVYVLLQ